MNGANWVAYANAGDPFAGPAHLFVDAGGRIYVADTYNDRIVRMGNMTGLGWTVFTSSGDPLFEPFGVFCQE